MNLILTPSLEQRALAKIAIALWSQDAVRDLMSKSVLHIFHDSWQGIEKVVIENSFKLQLPETLKGKLLDFIVRVGLQILSWVDFHLHRYSFVIDLPTTFVWTPLGTIDNIRTAELLVFDNTLEINESFTLACMYCLEDEIRCFWDMWDLSWNSPIRSSISESMPLVSFWVQYMEELDRLDLEMESGTINFTSYECHLLESATSGNEAATRYFLQKVNTTDNNFLVEIARNVASRLYILKDYLSIDFFLERYSGVMLFLLSTMNIEQQAEIFMSCTYVVLKCLLVWPWQSLFWEMITDKWDLLSKENYNELLYDMINSMGYKHNLRKLFGKFWQQSPETYRQFVIDQGHFVGLLRVLYQKGDEKNIRLILEDSSISARKNLILNDGGEQICIYLVSSEKWDSVEFLIQKCISSQEDLIKFTERFRTCVTTLHSGDEFKMECQWDKFFSYLKRLYFQI